MDAGEYTRHILDETRSELGHADNKASILFAAAGVVIGALLAGLISHDWDPSKCSSVKPVMADAGRSAS